LLQTIGNKEKEKRTGESSHNPINWSRIAQTNKTGKGQTFQRNRYIMPHGHLLQAAKQFNQTSAKKNYTVLCVELQLQKAECVFYRNKLCSSSSALVLILPYHYYYLPRTRRIV
jgi:hypothetical protein